MASPTEQIKDQLFAARTEAFQQVRATNFFKTLLLVLSVIGVLALVIYTVNYTTIESRVREPFDNKEAYSKIAELEKQLKVLKSDIAEVRKPNPIVAAAQGAIKWAVTYWVLLGFLFGVAAVIYVKLRFKIDYFETYRDLATKKMLSEFYRNLGDRMMIWSEWNAAETAYRDSLAINPTNVKATYGIAKVGVFQPLKGEKSYATEVAEMKIDYLIRNPPPNAKGKDIRRDFAQLYFIKGLSRADAGDDSDARVWQKKAIQTDPTFVGAHLELGYLHENAGEIEDATQCYSTAVQLEPRLGLANHNLGGIYLITGHIPEAIEHLERAYRTSPSLMTALALGDAYAYAGKFEEALRLHTSALANTNIPGIKKERYIKLGGTWVYNFMPLRQGDTDTIRRNVRIDTFEQKKMLTFMAVAFDHALLGNIQKADERFGEAQGREGAEEFSELFLNKIQSILNLIKPNPPGRTWLEKKAQELSAQAKPPPT